MPSSSSSPSSLVVVYYIGEPKKSHRSGRLTWMRKIDKHAKMQLISIEMNFSQPHTSSQHRRGSERQKKNYIRFIIPLAVGGEDTGPHRNEGGVWNTVPPRYFAGSGCKKQLALK